MAEDGLSDFKSYGWTAVFAPAHTPSPVIQRLNNFVVDAIRGQNARDVMEKVGNVVVGSSPAELESFVTQETKTWGPIIKDAHISLG